VAYFYKRHLSTVAKYKKLSAKMALMAMVVTGNIGAEGNEADALTQRVEQLALTESNPAIIFRTTYGGSIYEGIPAYNAILAAKPITIIEGLAGSMSGMLFLAGEKRKMDRLSQFHVHRPKIGVVGNADDIKSEAAGLASLEESIINIYAERTGQTVEFVKTNWFDGSDHFFGAEYCLAHGIITEIIESPAVPASASAIEIEDGETPEMLATALNKVMLSPKPTETNEPMFTTEFKKTLNLDENATDEQVLAKVAEGQTAISQLAEMKVAQATAEAAEKESLIDTAAVEGKLLPGKTAEMKAIVKDMPLAAVKTMVANMQKHVSLTQQIKAGGGSTGAGELETLAAMSYEDLAAANKLMTLKELDEPTFQAKYKEKHGKFYGEYKG
jgi:ATP-dependent protease ClpP protease subunit/molybdenum cofactor biosynthesis enzyme